MLGHIFVATIIVLPYKKKSYVVRFFSRDEEHTTRYHEEMMKDSRCLRGKLI